MSPWIADWTRAFLVTVAVEMIVAIPILGRVEVLIFRRVAAVVLVNLASHPLVWFLFPAIDQRYGVRLALSEIWAFGSEAGAYLVIWPKLALGRAALVSLLANAASLLVGLVARAL